MECSIPPPLDDDKLSAILDGTAAPQLLEHIAHCPFCSARLEQARMLEGRLHSQLRRWDCPPAERLGEYQLELLAPDETRLLRQHLGLCTRCTDELAQLRLFLLADERPPAPIPRPARPVVPARAPLGLLIARVQPSSAGAALRGAAVTTLTAEADGVTLLLELQPKNEGVVVQGQLLADAAEQWVGALVELRQGGVVATATLDDLGGFRCRPVVAQETALRITPQRGPALLVEGLAL